MFDVKQLRVLRAVAEHGSFSAAAEALSYTQPAISQQIAALEKRAGTTLVDRGSRGVRLTDAGRALVEHAEVVLARLAAAEAELEAIAGMRGGRVRLSSFPTAGASSAAARGGDVHEPAPGGRAQLRRAGARGGGADAACGRARGGARVRVPRPIAARVRSPLRGHRAAPPDRRPDVPRAAARPPRRAQAARAARGRGRTTSGSRTTPAARAAACTWRPARRPASSRRSASSPTTTTSSRA